MKFAHEDPCPTRWSTMKQQHAIGNGRGARLNEAAKKKKKEMGMEGNESGNRHAVLRPVTLV